MIAIVYSLYRGDENYNEDNEIYAFIALDILVSIYQLRTFVLLATKVNGIKIPQSYKQAIRDKNYTTKWEEAIKEELSALATNSTQEEVVLLKGEKTISTKQVFIIKIKADSSIECFKARLVIRGFS